MFTGIIIEELGTQTLIDARRIPSNAPHET